MTISMIGTNASLITWMRERVRWEEKTKEIEEEKEKRKRSAGESLDGELRDGGNTLMTRMSLVSRKTFGALLRKSTRGKGPMTTQSISEEGEHTPRA